MVRKIKKLIGLSALLAAGVVVSFDALLGNLNVFATGGNLNENYSLNLMQLNATNKTITTSNHNQITFELNEYSNGFSANGYLNNADPISGIQSITIGFTNESDSLSVAYGWEYDRYLVKDAVISGTSSTYTFNEEAPSYFFIKNGGQSVVFITSFVINYSCSATVVPEARASFRGYHSVEGNLSVWSNYNTNHNMVFNKSYTSKDDQGSLVQLNYDYGNNNSYIYYYRSGDDRVRERFIMTRTCILHFDFEYRRVMLSDVIEVYLNETPMDLDKAYQLHLGVGDEIRFFYTGHETFDSNHNRIYSTFKIHMRLVLG